MESIPLVGVPYSLVYSSLNVAGRKDWYTASIPITGSTFVSDPEVTAETLNLQIAGQVINRTYTPAADILDSFEWDGKDHLGNPVAGSVPLQITVHRTYSPTPPYPASGKTYSTLLGIRQPEWLGLGGWVLSILHQYDASRTKLLRGDGTARTVYYTSRSGGGYRVVGDDGDEVYHFDSNWRHVETLYGLTGTTKYSFNYNGSGKLSSVVDANLNTTTFNYSSGVLTSITAPFGQTTTVNIDGDGYLESVTNPASEAFEMTYYSGGLLHVFQKPGGSTATMVYDLEGRLLSDTSSVGSSTTIVATASGAMRTIDVTSAEGRASQHIASPETSRYVRLSTDPDSVASNYTIDTAARTRYDDDSLGFEKTQTFANDARFGSLLEFRTALTEKRATVTRSTAFSQSVALNTPGDPFDIDTLTRTATTSGLTHTEVYDGATRTFSVTSPEGRTSSRVTDAQERTISYQRSSLTPFTYDYDANGRLIEITQGSSRVTSFTYHSSSGFLATMTNPLNQTRTYAYDAAGRVVSETLPDTRVISYGYDADGNLNEVTPPGKDPHEFSFNGWGLVQNYVAPAAQLLVSAIVPDSYSEKLGSFVTRAWEGIVRAGARTAYILSPSLGHRVLGMASTTTTYDYDNDRNLVEITTPDGEDIEFFYDSAKGHLTAVTTPSGTNSHFYLTNGSPYYSDSYDNVRIHHYPVGDLPTSELMYDLNNLFAFNVDFTYSNRHLLESERLYAHGSGYGFTVDYTYDDDGLLEQAENQTLLRSSTTGDVTGTTLGNLTQIFSYSSGYGELEEIEAKYSGTTKYHEELTRDALGRITNRIETYGTTATTYDYTYDSAGRLTDVAIGASPHSHYAYDSNSNRTSQTISSVVTNATYDGQDRLETFGTKEFTYNLNGVLASVLDTATSNTTSYNYDLLGNLKSVTLPGSVVISYRVDAKNRRFSRSVNGTLGEYYIYGSQDRIHGTADASGVFTATFIYGTKKHVPDYVVKGSDTYQIIANHLGSPVMVINVSSGAVAQEIHYDEFGNVTSDSNPGFQPFGFAGCLYDVDTKLCHFGAREYDASTGRWLTKDPIRFHGGDTNLYGYVLQDPINSFDPAGTGPVTAGIVTAVCLAIDAYGYYGALNQLASVTRQINSLKAENARLLKELNMGGGGGGACDAGTLGGGGKQDPYLKIQENNIAILELGKFYAMMQNNNTASGIGTAAACLAAGALAMAVGP